MRLFFSAGEASGDAYGAALLRSLRACDAQIPRIGTTQDSLPPVLVQAIGGRSVHEAGAKLIADSSRWGAMGVYESLRVAPRILRGYLAARNALASGESGLFVPIDFGYLNVRLARYAKAQGWKVLYFVPPGSWRRNEQGADLPAITDAIVTPFSWSADMLRAMGAEAYWFGHPLKQMVAEAGPAPEPRDSIAVLPGSRGHEIARNLEPIVQAVADTPRPVEAALAPSVDPDLFRQLWRRAGGDPAKVRASAGDTYGVLRRARAAVVCSGTATLEAALCGCPSVVVYRGSKIMEIEYRLRKPKFDHIALPNILLARRAMPELIQWDATPERIRVELHSLLEEGAVRNAQLACIAELDESLGPALALDRTADLIRSMLC